MNNTVITAIWTSFTKIIPQHEYKDILTHSVCNLHHILKHCGVKTVFTSE